MPTLIFTSAFAGLLITSFGVLLQALYLANDMDFLLASPIPMRAVFITKMVQAILPNFGLISLFGLPVLIGMGIANGYNILYYIFLLILLVTVALAAAGLSSLLVMGIVRIFPARRVAEVLAFFGAIISFLCSQSGQFTRTLNLRASQTDPNQIFSTLSRLDVPWSPFAWAGNGLLDIAQGSWLPGLGLLLLTTALGFGIFLVALFTSERLYYSGWARIQINVRKKRAAPRVSPVVGKTARPAGLGRSLFGWIPAPIRAIVRKDWLMLRRDLRNMSQLVTPLLFGIIYSVTLFRRGGPGGDGAELSGRVPVILSSLINLCEYRNLPLRRLDASIPFGDDELLSGGKKLLAAQILPAQQRQYGPCQIFRRLSAHPRNRLGLPHPDHPDPGRWIGHHLVWPDCGRPLYCGRGRGQPGLRDQLGQPHLG